MSRLISTEARSEGEGCQSVVSFLLRRQHYRGPRGRASHQEKKEKMMRIETRTSERRTRREEEEEED